MWIFFTLVGLGLAFMLYALFQFHGDIKGRRSRERQGTDAKSDIAGGGRLLHIRSKQAVGNDSDKTGTKGWSHGNGEIRFHRVGTAGDVFVRGIRASVEPKSGLREKARNSSKTD